VSSLWGELFERASHDSIESGALSFFRDLGSVGKTVSHYPDGVAKMSREHLSRKYGNLFATGKV
jgi:hypothetical protein